MALGQPGLAKAPALQKWSDKGMDRAGSGSPQPCYPGHKPVRPARGGAGAWPKAARRGPHSRAVPSSPRGGGGRRLRPSSGWPRRAGGRFRFPRGGSGTPKSPPGERAAAGGNPGPGPASPRLDGWRPCPSRAPRSRAGAMSGAGGAARRDSLLYYYCLKFSLSAYAMLFSIIGLVVLCIGIYAEVERQKHRTLEGLFLAPAVILLLLGITMFAVSFIGMVGSLRDNRLLLKTFFWVLLAIFITELLLLFIEIIFEKQMNAVFHSSIQDGIRHYYDDLDFKNILDFVQQKFSCCGGDEFRDWHVNPYHSCNSSGPLACGVPYTCCTKKAPGEVINTLCGYRTLNRERLELVDTIHVRGCIHAVGFWLKDNFGATFAIVCSLLIPQAIGLAMSWLYWQKLNEIHARLDTVDFKLLDMSDFNFASLDLTGAGWCWCLPREGGYIPVGNKDDDVEDDAIYQSKV
ncbi:tetraspanin-15-like [Elgaria multicarinata webbii]|uniref:tetraspanin-15-like n=1 Tax=Elgaria multicarinata webbii TaxID=159646 RepID=UPI002FCCC344